MRVVRAFELFPVQGSQMAKYAPEMYIACKYMCSNNQDVTEHFVRIWTAISASGTLGANINRIVKLATFNPNLQLVSVILFCTLSMIYHVEHNVHDLAEYLLLAKGHYVGCFKYGIPNRLDNIELQMLRTESDEEI